MHLLAEVPQTTVELVWDRQLDGSPAMRARQLRGALARVFADNDLFHQRDQEGQLLYRYPQVQYRWWKGNGLITGWQQGADRLRVLSWLDLELTLHEQRVRVTDALIDCSHAQFYCSERLHHYVFGTPVLLFNQKNYQNFKTLDKDQQHEEQDRLLIAQILTGMRGLQVNFPYQLYATFTHVKFGTCYYKKQELLGIEGRFVCNAVLPRGFAIGHAVSHGYGWILQSLP